MLLTAEATIATTDAVLLATIIGVQGVLLRIYRAAREEHRRLHPAGDGGLGGAGALGILVKGPVTPGVAAATIVALLSGTGGARPASPGLGSRPPGRHGAWL